MRQPALRLKHRIRVGDRMRVWWAVNGGNVATVLAVLPYTGAYPQYADCVLRLTSDTPRGWGEMSYDSGNWLIDRVRGHG